MKISFSQIHSEMAATQSPTDMYACSHCKAEVAAAEFSKSELHRRIGGFAGRCRECVRFGKVLSKYRLTRGEYDAMLEEQEWRCRICKGVFGRELPAVVDHCHETRRVRGLLCANCNTAVGMLADDPVRALGLAAYLTPGEESAEIEALAGKMGALKVEPEPEAAMETEKEVKES
jgi:hypothetical protein